MDNSNLVKDIRFNLSSVEHCRLGTEWNYKNIISPFTRLYLITEGEAYILLGDKKIILRKDHLYLIPSFQECTYCCNDYMEQFYTTFTIHLPNNLSIYQLYNFYSEVKANKFHYELFDRLCKANPNRELPIGDPIIYQRMNLNKLDQHSGAKENLITQGLISLLWSEFIKSKRMVLKTGSSGSILDAIIFIQNNLSKLLTVADLAGRYFISPDHFTRKFKELTKQNPIDYINKQRIEKALLLINTTSDSCKEVGYRCGFNSNTYFSKIFKAYVGLSPSDYRSSLTSNN